jgi:hypothetical protein
MHDGLYVEVPLIGGWTGGGANWAIDRKGAIAKLLPHDDDDDDDDSDNALSPRTCQIFAPAKCLTSAEFGTLPTVQCYCP